MQKEVKSERDSWKEEGKKKPNRVASLRKPGNRRECR